MWLTRLRIWPSRLCYKDGIKGNLACQIQIGAGFSSRGYAVTLEQQCGSSMRAAEIISRQIMLGKTDIGLAIGIESMSRTPHLMLNSREGYRMGDIKVVDSLTYDGLNCAMCGYHIGVIAENLA